MNDHPHVVFLLQVAAGTALLAIGVVYAAWFGAPLLWIAALAAILVAAALRPLDKRHARAQMRIRELETESLEQRRAIYRLKKDDPNRGPRASTSQQPMHATDSALASAVAAISTELNESRLIECIVRSTLETLVVDGVSLHLHDRGSDRFQRGVAFVRADSAISRIERAVSPEDEVVLRLALKRRIAIARDASDGEVRRAFEVAPRELLLAVPLFDRAVVSGVLLIHGRTCDRAAAEILAATGSLALSAVQRRSERAAEGTRAAPREDRAHA